MLETRTAPAALMFPAHVLPNREAQAIPNLVPGAEMLGYGFHIFGTYSFDSATRPLFSLGTPSTQMLPNGVEYNVPSNIGGVGGGESSASAYAFDSASQFASHFQGEAGISGSYGAFSASFSSSYSSDQQNSVAYSWALVESKILSWSVRLNAGPGTLRPDVRSDPDWSNLPSTFDASNAHLFYALFAKFGTHYISEVDVGGMLYYYYAVARSSSLSQREITMSASAEYNALIAKGKVEASAQWSQCAKNWTSSRQSHALTVPATSSVVNWVNPPSGAWDENGTFAAWQNAVEKYPARTTFQLTPISQIFSGQQAAAVQQAYAAYTATRVYLQSRRQGVCTIIIGGLPIVPPGGYPSAYEPAWQLVVLDRKSLAIRMNKYYPINYQQANWPDPTYSQMGADLQPYVGPQGNAILIMAGSYMDDGASPTAPFYGILESFGAGPLLGRWMAGPNHNCSGGAAVAYGLVGASGAMPGSAIEDFVDIYSNGPPGDSITLNVHLQPQADGTFLPSNV